MESDTSFEALVEKAFLGDSVAFEKLRRQIHVFQCYMGNHRYAEDATQQVLITVWQRYKTDVRDRSKLESWVLRIAQNQALDYLRRSRPDLSLDAEDDPDESPLHEFVAVTNTYDLPEECLKRQEFNHLVWEALEELPMKHRSCLVLRLALEVKTTEIARLHNLSEEHVRRLIRSGREQFKDAYIRCVSEQQMKEGGQVL